MKIELDSDFKSVIEFMKQSPEKFRVSSSVAILKVARAIRRKAQTNHKFKTKTGLLEKSVTMPLNLAEKNGEIEASVYLDPKVANYAEAVHNGWKRTKAIIPIEKKALRWGSSGGFVFASKVSKPASYSGDPFLFNAYDSESVNLIKEVLKQIEKGL